MRKKVDTLQEMMDKIRKLEELTGDKNLKNSKMIEQLINKYLSKKIKNFNNRIMSENEKKVLTNDAFSYLLSLVNNEVLLYTEFEKVLNILIQFSDEMDKPLDELSVILLLEMMSYANYDEDIIRHIIKLYLSTPELMHDLNYIAH
ncbi:MAG: DUF494 family protein [Candidatus Cloacimonadales bacterium]|jgi:hypothetical protein|nr:DUF494 family protein [Candidatus Cloacimonadota bacterium]MDD2649733.1 DUF494 family protein [Candidatus Cloacimonadota bacterium]MDD3501068.1 DUF494 family protein [Candidatus Cloacimonadota bacterium]MDX9978046.1 DUF494 family protein [Candidatus Cloacimonadales bacterium]